MIRKAILSFIFPKPDRKFFVRLVVLALFSYLFFAYVCLPERIRGKSMEPTYKDGSFTFCLRICYLFSEPERGDVVMIRFAGEKIMLLKRIVGLEGDIVAFENGTLMLNGKALHEPYLSYPCDWNLPPKKVESGKVYVVGDRRDVPVDSHQFGQVSKSRIAGTPLW